MLPTRLMVLKAASQVPLVGEWFRLKYYNELILQLDTLKKQLSSPSIRFNFTVHQLYTIVHEAHNISLVEDFKWFNGLTQVYNSVTSSELSEALKGILDGSPQSSGRGFKDYTIRPAPLMSWYSNKGSFDNFLENAVAVIGIYCNCNPLNEEVGNTIKYSDFNWNHTLRLFISDRHFKFLIYDLLSALNLVLTSQIRVLNGEADQGS